MSDPERNSTLRVGIVGGGISGLATAHALLRDAPTKGQGVSLTIFESERRLGGKLVSERRDGFLIDAAADSFVVTKPHALALCRELGLESRLIETIPENRRVYVVRGGELTRFPQGLVFGVPTRFLPFLNSSLLSLGGKLRVLAEAGWSSCPTDDSDISLGDFLERRFGTEMMDVILEPLLGGIYAGDARKLSLRSTFPQWFRLHTRGESVIRAVARERRAPAARVEHADGARHELTDRSPFRSLVGGIGELVETLAQSVRKGAEVREGARVKSVEREGEAFRLELTSGESFAFDRVVLTQPPHLAARVVSSLDAALAGELAQIPLSSAATVFLAFDRAQVRHPLDASGFLVPLSERKKVMAATFVSSKWRGRAPEGKVLMRAFVGGAHDEAAVREDEATLSAAAMAEIRSWLGIEGEPLFTSVYRFIDASPQPVLGHSARVERIRERVSEIRGLSLVGNAYDGVGIPDCVRLAGEAAAEILS